jgi:hypothetical protein
MSYCLSHRSSSGLIVRTAWALMHKFALWVCCVEHLWYYHLGHLQSENKSGLNLQMGIKLITVFLKQFLQFSF